MTSLESTGTIASLWRAPVKSMAGESTETAELTPGGVLGDRAYALVDVKTGKIASAKSVKQFPDILRCRARFVEAPRAGIAMPPVRIELPDGTSVISDSGEADRVLSAHFSREVSLSRSAPEDFTIDMYQPDIDGAVPEGSGGTTKEQKLGSSLFAEMGVNSPLPPGSFLDAFPLSLVTTSTLRSLDELEPRSRFDVRRFRMNVVVETPGTGFPENDWVGTGLAIGEARLQFTMQDARCVMTTLEQEDLPADAGILKAIAQHNRIQVGEVGRLPCVGIYAVVIAPGAVRVGDPVSLVRP